MTDLFQKYNEIQEEIKQLEAILRTAAQEAFAEGAKAFFAVYPEVHEFSWTQYTPYFNDGDECVFGVQRDYGVEVNGEEIMEDYEDGTIGNRASKTTLKKINNSWERVPNPDYDPRAESLREDLSHLLNAFDDGTLKSLFGDHCKITVTPKEVTVDEYLHD